MILVNKIVEFFKRKNKSKIQLSQDRSWLRKHLHLEDYGSCSVGGLAIRMKEMERRCNKNEKI